MSSPDDGVGSSVDISHALDALELSLKSCDEGNHTITINREGPLLLKLRLETCAGVSLPSILGFDVDENNKNGEIESDGRFSVGDLLVQVNGVSTRNMELADVFQLLQEVGGEYRKLAFMKPLDASKRSLTALLTKSTPSEVLDDGGRGAAIKLKPASSEALIQNIHNIFAKEGVINPDSLEINYGKLQTISTSGLNDTVRCVVWSILLGCLSPLTILDEVPGTAESTGGGDMIVVPMRRGGRWLEELAGNHAEYETIVNDMLVMDEDVKDPPSVPVAAPVKGNDSEGTRPPPSGGWCVSTLTIRPPTVPLHSQEDGDSNLAVVSETVPEEGRLSEEDTGETGCPAPVKKDSNMDPRWTAYYADLVLADNIARDVTRTLPHIAFFTVNNVAPRAIDTAGKCDTSISAGSADCENLDENGQPPDIGAGNPLATNSHLQCIERVLYVHAKLNHALKYVQGMNEIAGTLYYVMANSPIPAIRAHAEAHAYTCFMSLMVEMQDLFIEEMDDSVFGVYARIRQYDALLHHTDPELHRWLVDELGIESHLYTFRWFTTLFTREFTLPDVIRIWDTLFADNDRKTFVLYIAVAMVCTLKEQLLGGDFTDNLTLLQAFPPDISVTDIMQQALRLRIKDRCASSGQPQAKRRSFVEMAASFSSTIKAYSVNSSATTSAAGEAEVEGSSVPLPAPVTEGGAKVEPVEPTRTTPDAIAAPAVSTGTSVSLRASFSAAMGSTTISFRSAFGNMMKSSAPVPAPDVTVSDVRETTLVSSTMEKVSGEAGENPSDLPETGNDADADAAVVTPATTGAVRSSIRSSFSQLWSRTTMLVPSVSAGADEPVDEPELTGRLSESDAALVSAFYKPDGDEDALTDLADVPLENES